MSNSLNNTDLAPASYQQISLLTDELSVCLSNQDSSDQINQRIVSIRSLIDQFRPNSEVERERVVSIQRNLEYISHPESRICGVCAYDWSEERQPVTLRCTHIFCETCLSKCGDTCPECRGVKTLAEEPGEREKFLRNIYNLPRPVRIEINPPPAPVLANAAIAPRIPGRAGGLGSVCSLVVLGVSSIFLALGTAILITPGCDDDTKTTSIGLVSAGAVGIVFVAAANCIRAVLPWMQRR